MSAKKSGRPKKTKEPQGDLRAPFKPWPDTPQSRKRTPEKNAELAEDFRQMFLQMNLDRVRVDPLNDEPWLAQELASVICGHWRTKQGDEDAASLFLYALTELNADQAEDLFRRVVKLKRNRESPPHPAAWAMFAYYNFTHDNGKEPTKDQLRKYICEHHETYPAHPPLDADSSWRDLWRLAGLFNLPSKVGKKS